MLLLVLQEAQSAGGGGGELRKLGPGFGGGQMEAFALPEKAA